jgi:RPA family protein
MVDQPRRQIAYKLRIADILKGQYVKKDGWQPNVVLVNGTEVSRVNIIATVVTKPVPEQNYVSVLLDDGTGKITLRSFEEAGPVNRIDIGEVVLVIGRPREYNSEKYVIPEIVKRINNQKWVELRQAELKESRFENDEKATEVKAEEMTDTLQSMSGRICDLIRKYDSGDGADYQQIVDSLNSPGGELAIEQLLKEGEIFEIRPGKLKLLE